MERPRLLLLETSHRQGWLAVARGRALLAQSRLEEARRHARDLVPTVQTLLNEQGWKPGDLDAVVVSLGPGSYTGLRVGIMSAKTLAYAVGCPLLGIETFAVIARQTPADRVDVVADAQQDKVYVQGFARQPSCDWHSIEALRIEPVEAWLARRTNDAWVSGPALETLAPRLTNVALAPPTAWSPTPESMLHVGLARWEKGERDDVFAVEPLYLRPSSAEENFKKD